MTDAVRNDFEAWYVKRWGGDRGDDNFLRYDDSDKHYAGQYRKGNVEFAWCAWAAARAALSEQPATHPAPVERVALTDKLIDAATIRHWGRRSAPALADHRGYARAVIAEYERINGVGTSAEVCRASQVGPDKWLCDCGGPPCTQVRVG